MEKNWINHERMIYAIEAMMIRDGVADKFVRNYHKLRKVPLGIVSLRDIIKYTFELDGTIKGLIIGGFTWNKTDEGWKFLELYDNRFKKEIDRLDKFFYGDKKNGTNR